MVDQQVFPQPIGFVSAVLKRAAIALIVVAGLGAASALVVSSASAGDTLTDKGAALAPVIIGAGVQDLRRSVDLGSDLVLATYVTARTVGGQMLVRTRNGFWLPWSGREEDLSDSGFAAAGATIEFKILKEELPAAALPVTVTLGYRTASGIKHGSFEVRAK